VLLDRLGANRAIGARFYPFGDEITSTANDREKFATYTRDSYTGLDYADQRYFASTYGRFNTADPYQASAGPKSPLSWNRYSYTRGDPVNRVDPRGLLDELTCGGEDGSSSSDCFGGGGGYSDSSCDNNSFLPDPSCYETSDQSATTTSTTSTPPPPTCEQAETAYVYSYLSKYKSPLAAYAATIVQDSDAAGIDDRFIVAIAGAETTYGNIKHADTWGLYNVFDNSTHCVSLTNPHCAAVNPFSSYVAAINNVTSLIGSGKPYQGESSANDIFSTYTGGESTKTLDEIYQKQLKGNLSNVRDPRCP